MATAAPCLKTLVLRHNNLRHLPAELRLPRALEHLDLAHNELSLAQDLDLALPKLRQCFLEYNKVDRLPLSLWSAASLRLLNASNNLLTCLPGSTAAYKRPRCRCVRAVGRESLIRHLSRRDRNRDFAGGFGRELQRVALAA
jgi:Leucine-rich repeat (LRR) protein